MARLMNMRVRIRRDTLIGAANLLESGRKVDLRAIATIHLWIVKNRGASGNTGLGASELYDRVCERSGFCSHPWCAFD
jgi:hypothetical protein